MKLIKKGFRQFIETNNEDLIQEAVTEGLEVTDIIPNPDNYQPDDSDRPETIAKIEAEKSRKIEQDKIDNEINKPNILQSLKELPYNFKSESERESMTWEELSEYHSMVVYMPNIIEEAKKLEIPDAESKIRQPLIDEINSKKKLRSNT